MEDTTEAIIMAITDGMEVANRQPQVATSDSVLQPSTADLAEEGQATVV
jgi:hypothetical protein